MRTRAEIHPEFRSQLENDIRRMQAVLETNKGSCTYKIYPRRSRKDERFAVFDIYMCDTTRRGDDGRLGSPILIGTAPFREQAEEFVRDHSKGKSVFYFRGFKTEFKKKFYDHDMLIRKK